MKRTISIKLATSPDQEERLTLLQQEFAHACNALASLALEHKCNNRVKLHHLGYYAARDAFPGLGSQMTCNSIASVVRSYKSLLSNNPGLKKTDWPTITFRESGSVHFDKRTYSIKDNALSLFTTQGRIVVPMNVGKFQKTFLETGITKEAELVRRKGRFYFNLVLDLPDVAKRENGKVGAVDLGAPCIPVKSLVAVNSGTTVTSSLPFVGGFNATAPRAPGNGSVKSPAAKHATSPR
jgi:putative transposase